jgi:hypothetical protein
MGQIKQTPTLPGPANQNLKWDVLRLKFGNRADVYLQRERLGWKTPKITLTGDTRARCISDHSLLACFLFLPDYCVLVISSRAKTQ